MNPPQPEKKPIAVTLVRKTDRAETAASLSPAPAAAATAPSDPTASSVGVTAPEVSAKPGAGPAATAVGKPPTGLDRFTRWVTRPLVAAPTVLLALGLLGWCFFIRLPGRPMIVHARPASPAPVINGLSPDLVAALSSQAEAASRLAMTNSDQLPRVVAELEQRAKAVGFVAEAITRPPVTPVAEIPGLSLHPIALRLENNYERDEPAFHRLLDWMRKLSSLGVKTEVVALNLQSLGDGMTIAAIELQIPSLQTNAQAAPE